MHYEDRAVAHLFTVVCGLDSMAVGEGQILGQVRQALRAAQGSGDAGRVLGELLQQALRVGKRAHAETGIDRAGRTIVQAGHRPGGRPPRPAAVAAGRPTSPTSVRSSSAPAR